METTPFTFVESPEQLAEVVEKLKQADVIAVDTEAHSFESYQGFVCLVQISTRTEDFVIDGLTLRHEMHSLNDPFTNPNIVKIFHSSTSDLPWMQRDFGVYCVGVFDTYEAVRALNLSERSFAALAQKLCGVTLDKQYQRADWRVR
ncbi:Exosome component 10, partial [Gonapodya sp. JEL0774]